MDNSRVNEIFERIQEIQNKWNDLKQKISRINNRKNNKDKFKTILNQEVNKKIDETDKKCLEKKIDEVSKKYNVDPNLIKAIIEVESNWNRYAVSHRGAKGLMQLMDITIRELGVKDPFDPEENIEAGTRFFSSLLKMYDNSLEEALSAYNYGPSKVKKGEGVPNVYQVQQYVSNILRKVL
ncbi:MAG: lytic transglycosylase domain-containing protein [Candidatus Hydrogenedentota bacterium]